MSANVSETTYINYSSGSTTLVSSASDLEVTITPQINDLWVANGAFTTIPSASLSTEIGQGNSPGQLGAYLLKQGETQTFKLRAGDELHVASGAGTGNTTVYSYYSIEV